MQVEEFKKLEPGYYWAQLDVESALFLVPDGWTVISKPESNEDAQPEDFYVMGSEVPEDAGIIKQLGPKIDPPK